MGKSKSVNHNVTNDVTLTTKQRGTKWWKLALTDAEIGLEKATRDVAQWRAAIAVIRKRIKTSAPWPGRQ